MFYSVLDGISSDLSKIPFLRRLDGSVNFTRDWVDYKSGFGDVYRCGEFWLGLDTLHSLTSSSSYGVRADMETWEGDRFWAEYSNMYVNTEADDYRLDVSGYNTSSSAGDGFIGISGRKFSTPGKDNDGLPGIDCGLSSGWWYSNCGLMAPTRVYGYTGLGGGGAVLWIPVYWNSYSFKTMELALIPR